MIQIMAFDMTILDFRYIPMCNIGAISHGYISTRAKKPFHTIAFTGCIHRVHCHISICTSLLNPIFICTFSPQNHTESSQDMHQKKISISREMFIAKNAYCGNLSALFAVAIYLFLNRKHLYWADYYVN